MQEVYEVKVRSRTDACQLYPSERRYSASTVGGLGLIHLLLGATTLLLATLGLGAEDAAWTRYGGGVGLGVAAVAAAAGALLAWRRWYVDNNIRHFLIASTAAGVVSFFCLIATVVALTSLEEELTSRRQGTVVIDKPTLRVDAAESYDVASPTWSVETSVNTSGVDPWDTANATTLDSNPLDFDADENTTLVNITQPDVPRPTVFQEQETPSEEIRNVLLVNILVASVLELVWSVLSARIAWRGVKSDYEGGEVKKRERVVVGAEKVRRVRPDILHNVMKGVEGVGGRELDANLPQRESCVEYEERVRRFLASNNLQGGDATLAGVEEGKVVQ